jgi:hypothetical protein
MHGSVGQNLIERFHSIRKILLIAYYNTALLRISKAGNRKSRVIFLRPFPLSSLQIDPKFTFWRVSERERGRERERERRK